jgi:quercetin dioxygenase-like cupin family protein
MNVQQVIANSALAGCIVSGSLPPGMAAAQTGGAVSEFVWENDGMVVHRVSLEPGARFVSDSPGGSVIAFLTTDLDGRMPQAEVAWRDPGPTTMENRGAGRFEALIVDLKGGATPPRRATPPEVVRAYGMVASRAFDGAYDQTVRAQNLIVNDRVSVTKERYGLSGSVDPLHFHPQDAVVIYLRGGYVWPAAPFYGPDRVRRGDVRVVPGNAFHLNGNAGSDPVEFLLIIPA